LPIQKSKKKFDASFSIAASTLSLSLLPFSPTQTPPFSFYPIFFCVGVKSAAQLKKEN